MRLTQSLDTLVAQARHAIDRDSHHDLPLGYRRAIWAALGPRMDDTRLAPTIGTRRRTHLAELTTRKVLPMWERTWPSDKRPERLLMLANGVLDGIVEPSVARAERRRFHAHLEDIGYGNQPLQIASAPGYAAIATLNTALRDEIFDPFHVDYAVTDAAVDPQESDASSYAAIAYAGGPAGWPDADAGERLDFWRWWLDEAVPRAWSSARWQAGSLAI